MDIKSFFRIIVLAAIILTIMDKIGISEGIVAVVIGFIGVVVMGKVIWELLKTGFGDFFHFFF